MTGLVVEQRKSGEGFPWRDTQTSTGNVGVGMKPLDLTDPRMVQWVLASSCCMTMPAGISWKKKELILLTGPNAHLT